MKITQLALLVVLPLGPLAAMDQGGCAEPNPWLSLPDGGPSKAPDGPAGIQDESWTPQPPPLESPWPVATNWNAEPVDATTPSETSVTSADTTDSANRRPAAPRPGQLIINEMMSDPSALTEALGEWVELYNPTAQSYQLEGCVLRDHDRDIHRIANPLLIAPNSYITLARDDEPQLGFTPDYVYSNFRLANGSDEVQLWCGGDLVDEVVYRPATGFPVTSGASKSLDPSQASAEANDIGSHWCAAPRHQDGETYGSNTDRPLGDRGSPGLPNPSCPNPLDQAPEDGPSSPRGVD